MTDERRGTPLDYGLPARSGPPASDPATGCMVFVFGIFAGLFAALMLFFGAFGTYHTLRHSSRVNVAEDLFEAGIFLVTGAFGAYVCVRWCRIRIRRRR